MSSGGLKISTRYLTQTKGGFHIRAHSRPICGRDGKVTGKPRGGLQSIERNICRPRKQRRRRMGGFVFFFSSFLPSSSHRRPTTSFPRNGVTFRSNITARRRDEHKVSFFSFRWVVECDLFLSAVFVHMNDRQERGCVHVTTDHGAQADQFCTTARTEMSWDCVRV